ncbi:uncharacterized protein K452DRAFT_307639 [Aplosporella prunicola CBS 121167]|uniref:IDI-2 n=1 Tax=Aplosporella prunicola CBS 121167 TaxID=1176127 RepID=A0A6A6BEV0_9PEZI|nr:uncharacterized protein K452DRAFT_307639 [Aplosporella prunicola CBS 121167]KAF2142699.1 hypothetical protein K452DRAFT_307639 [Aplosporella prunicola CBS 121167]
MKFYVGIIFAAAASTRVLSAAVSDTAAECGSLGVMSIDNIPEDVDAANVRKCANHPLGRNRPLAETSLGPMEDSNDTSVEAPSLQARDCWFGAEYGCTKGYCWRTCGTVGKGTWCWTASDGGTGPWYTCKTYSDCNKSQPCGKNCDKCGCSC